MSQSPKHDPKQEKLVAHIKAVEEHKLLLDTLHLNGEADLTKTINSLENLGITLEEYLKVVGIP
jgi:hypothetical protein